MHHDIKKDAFRGSHKLTRSPTLTPSQPQKYKIVNWFERICFEKSVLGLPAHTGPARELVPWDSLPHVHSPTQRPCNCTRRGSGCCSDWQQTLALPRVASSAGMRNVRIAEASPRCRRKAWEGRHCVAARVSASNPRGPRAKLRE